MGRRKQRSYAPCKPHTKAHARRAGVVAAIALAAITMACALALWPRGALPAPHTANGTSQDIPAPSEWDWKAAPDYYAVQGPAHDVFELDEPGVDYGEPDNLGRATYAEGLVDAAMMREGTSRPRGDMSATNPTGWGNNERVDINLGEKGWYHGFFWNRSHLLAKSLGGDDQTHNLICGTRTQNVGANDGEGGMAYGETLCREWLDEHPDGQVSYRATASYVGWEQVPRSVFVDMRSSDGSIDQHVEVYNAARGYSIDYGDGTFEATADPPHNTQAAQGGQAAQDTQSDQREDQDDDLSRLVVVSGSGKAYHRNDACSGLHDADRSQLRTVTLEEARGMGRHACGICGG